MTGSKHTWQQRTEAVLAQSCLTYSKSRKYYVDAQPSHVIGVKNGMLVDPGGTAFLDTVSGLGANLIDIQNSFSLPSTLEVECAEKVIERLGQPGWKLKFVKTGSEADVAAARFIRGHTGRTGIWKVGYTGWGSEYIAAEEVGRVGCPPTDVRKFKNHEELLQVIRSGEALPAGVIMEPVILDIRVQSTVRDIVRECKLRAILVCFDEVITCFRFPKYTVAASTDTWPDLITTGKGLGGGFPLGLVMGRPEIMDKPGVFVSGTFSGETTGLQGAMQVLDYMTPRRMDEFCKRCMTFQVRLASATMGRINIDGYGTRMVLRDGDCSVAVFMQEMWKRHRVLIGPVLFPRVSWDKEFDTIINAAKDVCDNTLKEVSLVGDPPSPVFKRN